MPLFVVLVGDLLVAGGFALIVRVYRENTFSSATIEVIKGQQVISTGPYAIVRHPMYASAFLYLIGTPLALGSYWGLLPIAAMMPFLIGVFSTKNASLWPTFQGTATIRRRCGFGSCQGFGSLAQIVRRNNADV